MFERLCFLTETEGSSQSSDDSDSIFRVCAELQQHRRESVPFTLQLKIQKHAHKVRIAHCDNQTDNLNGYNNNLSFFSHVDL